MADYSYLHVAMHGHFDGRLTVKYAFNADKNEWMASLPDPDAIVRNFMSVRECYVLWRNENGHYFSVITTDPLDPSAGRVMVTLVADNGCMLPGRAVFTALSGLKKTFLEDRILTDEAVARALEAASIPREPIKLDAWQVNKPQEAEQVQPMCYRTFLSTRELESVFSFPDQPEYGKYFYDIIINATASLRPGIAIDRLTSPIAKIYSVICPEGVTASAETVEDGKQIVLTFSKEGFAPRKETVTAGVPSAYVIYDGSLMKVKSPSGPNMGFTRKVRLTVKNSKGGLVNGYTVSVNDRPVNTMEPFIELTEADLQPGRRVEIQVASNNFHPIVKEYDSATLSREAEIEIVLVPVEQGITLRLVFGEGRVFEQQISLEKNTPEYSQLHSGNFHGFRAQKMVTPHGGEVYNVDVRAASKPVAPSFTNVAADRNAPRQERVVPHFENVSADNKAAGTTPAAKSEEHTQKPKETESVKQPVNPTDEPSPRPDRTKAIVACVIGVVVILLAIFFIPAMFGSKDAESNVPDVAENTEIPTESTDAPIAVANAETAEPAPAATTDPSADEKADIDYLNSAKVWKLSELKSEKYRALFNALSNGDLNAIASNDYFAVKDRCTNTEANKIADMTWQAIGTDNEGGNKRALTKAGSNGEINVHELYEDLARRKPKTPNDQPRPTR